MVTILSGIGMIPSCPLNRRPDRFLSDLFSRGLACIAQTDWIQTRFDHVATSVICAGILQAGIVPLDGFTTKSCWFSLFLVGGIKAFTRDTQHFQKHHNLLRAKQHPCENCDHGIPWVSGEWLWRLLLLDPYWWSIIFCCSDNVIWGHRFKTSNLQASRTSKGLTNLLKDYKVVPQFVS